MKRARGYALTELLVAIAIGGLIVGVLTFLNVEYVGLAQRVSDLQGPYDIGRRAQTGASEDLCANPGAVLRAGLDRVSAQSLRDTDDVLILKTDAGGASTVSGPGGRGGTTSRPMRIVVESAANPGGSLAAIEVRGSTVGVVAPRCDLPEVCDYDATNSLCKADEETPVAQPG
jgi:prepilin-type N-terminal cleavage/methylation domain-containing protein